MSLAVGWGSDPAEGFISDPSVVYPSAMSRGPLSGVVVVDLTRVLSGPFATLQLADLGAEIIKIERPGSGDDTRGFGPPFVGGESTYFMSVNRGKRSLALDLKQPEGRDLALRLIENADVVIENFRPGVAERLGLGGEQLRARHPRLVTCSISGFGAEGDPAFTTRGGYDAVVQAVSGLMSFTGEPEGAEMRVGVALSDMVAGLYAAQGILAALYRRDRSGEGAHLDISMQDAMLSLTSYQAGSTLQTGRSPKRMGNAHPSICPYETVRVADGPFVLAVGNDKQFASFCRLLERPELAEDPRFATNGARVEHRDALMALIEPELLKKDGATWDALLTGVGIPGGPVLPMKAALEHPQVAARQTLLEHQHPTAGTIRSVGSPVRLGPPVSAPPPRLGEHGRDLLRERLGLSPEELDALEASGVLGQA